MIFHQFGHLILYILKNGCSILTHKSSKVPHNLIGLPHNEIKLPHKLKKQLKLFYYSIIEYNKVF